MLSCKGLSRICITHFSIFLVFWRLSYTFGVTYQIIFSHSRNKLAPWMSTLIKAINWNSRGDKLKLVIISVPQVSEVSLRRAWFSQCQLVASFLNTEERRKRRTETQSCFSPPEMTIIGLSASQIPENTTYANLCCMKSLTDGVWRFLWRFLKISGEYKFFWGL